MKNIVEKFTPLSGLKSELLVTTELSNETKYPDLKLEVTEKKASHASLSSNVKQALQQANITGEAVEEGMVLELSYNGATATAINLGSSIMDITAPAYLAQKLNTQEDIVKMSLTFRTQDTSKVVNRKGVIRGDKGEKVAKSTHEVTVSISEISETSVNIFEESCNIRNLVANIMKYNAYNTMNSIEGEAARHYLKLVTYYEAKSIMYNNDSVQQNPSVANSHLQAVINAPRMSEDTFDLSIYAALAIFNPANPTGFFSDSFLVNSDTKRYKSITLGDGGRIITKKFQSYMMQLKVPVVGYDSEELKELAIKIREMDIMTANSLAIDEIRYSEGFDPAEISFNEEGLLEAMKEVSNGLKEITGSSKKELLSLLNITEADEIAARGQAAEFASSALSTFLDSMALDTSL